MSKCYSLNKPSSLKSREELLEENDLLYREVLAARKAAAITADLVVEQFSRMEEINQSLGKANAELQKISSLDGLTGIANRRFHDEMLAREWRRCRRSRQPLSLVMVDIDYFKLFNDCYGHPAGDSCLKRVAEILQDVIHRSADMVARYGGEEFVYTLPESDVQAALAVAEKARKAVEDAHIPHETSKIASCLTLSLGVASIVPDQFMEPSALGHMADEALYAAKEQGRNCVKVFA